eukprot:456653-Rhodomonas_salina.1
MRIIASAKIELIDTDGGEFVEINDASQDQIDKAAVPMSLAKQMGATRSSCACSAFCPVLRAQLLLRLADASSVQVSKVRRPWTASSRRSGLKTWSPTRR